MEKKFRKVGEELWRCCKLISNEEISYLRGIYH